MEKYRERGEMRLTPSVDNRNRDRKLSKEGVLIVNPSDFTAAVEPSYSEEALEKLRKAKSFVKIVDAVTLENELQQSGIHTVIQDMAQDVAQAQDAMILKAIREANEEGKHGVKVVRTRMGFFMSVSVDSSVPLGELHVYDTEDDLRLAFDSINDVWFYGRGTDGQGSSSARDS